LAIVYHGCDILGWFPGVRWTIYVESLIIRVVIFESLPPFCVMVQGLSIAYVILSVGVIRLGEAQSRPRVSASDS
jgi:hypothetical protein